MKWRFVVQLFAFEKVEAKTVGHSLGCLGESSSASHLCGVVILDCRELDE